MSNILTLGGFAWGMAQSREQAAGYALAVTLQPQLCRPKNFIYSNKAPHRGLGYIASTVTMNTFPAADRRVICYTQRGDKVAETRSDANGNYRFDGLRLTWRYMLIAQDKPEYGEAEYNAVAADYQQATAYET
ncbi:hypothetical protein [Agarivorans sp. QJM3NY_25]|uniref:hypothetical protein n=1 Tax=Agarivorans sp. QJM3NY_25 TaxID=3421430 RepID=UPI003D7EA41F